MITSATDVKADTNLIPDGYRPGQAELLCASLAACLPKNIERYSAPTAAPDKQSDGTRTIATATRKDRAIASERQAGIMSDARAPLCY